MKARTFLLPFILAGALLSLVTVYALATRGGQTPIATLLLSGIALAALLGAASSLLISLNIVSWQIAPPPTLSSAVKDKPA